MKGLDKFDDLVKAFNELPSIGKKSAIKLAYYACVKDPLHGAKLAHSLDEALRFIKKCRFCGGLAQGDICTHCEDDSKNHDLLCLVEDARDILILQSGANYDGLYFVYDEKLSNPMDNLLAMIQHFGVKELIFAFTHNINKEALSFYIEEKLKNKGLMFSKIAQGIPSGVALENVDLMSVYKALAHRTKL